jgi:hypothetical protein
MGNRLHLARFKDLARQFPAVLILGPRQVQDMETRTKMSQAITRINKGISQDLTPEQRNFFGKSQFLPRSCKLSSPIQTAAGNLKP